MPFNRPSVPHVPRLTSLDAYRGFVMLLMGMELLELDKVAAHFPGNAVWQWIGFHAAHVPWVGGSLHDLIHPSFSFMVGVALPFSLASRLAKGQSKLQMACHAGLRALLLIFLGIFVSSLGRPITNWVFHDTLTQMGLGYPVVFLLAYASTRVRWTAIAVILVSYWLFFICHPLPSPELLAMEANIPAGWTHHMDGFFGHWNLNQNAAWSFDIWFLNLFPRQRPFIGFNGGYNTLNFIPTIATMILGLIAGTWLKDASNSHRLAEASMDIQRGAMRGVIRRLLVTGAVLLLLGWGLQAAGICPIVKRIWTPAWVLYSGGWCCAFMAVFYTIIDVKGFQRWAFPLVVIGMNSIAMYLMFHTIDKFIGETLVQHLGRATFLILGAEFQPILHGGGVLATIWLILLWMHRRKLYLRV